ncbi:MAG: carbamoyltransferase HypF [Candidatus Competibacterales bacterium]
MGKATGGAPLQRATLRVRGRVQGVGFRPFVWQLAHRLGVVGEVCNDGEGVLIRAVAPDLAPFIAALWAEQPPLAQVTALEQLPLGEDYAPTGFRIAATSAGPPRTAIPPDAALCVACRAEMDDPTARRYGYPFTNCSHCGPRFSIVTAMPYDRAGTTMAPFALCSDCRGEYHDPADRRFHAQPIACPRCGPTLWLERRQGGTLSIQVERAAPLGAAVAALVRGEILAVKGIGGFHLACSATSSRAVATLRHRKGRPSKPLAVMFKDLQGVAQHCELSPGEAALLTDPAAPVVLLRRRPPPPGVAPLAAEVAPALDTLGVLLPYGPLHQLLMAQVDPLPLVMSSGNRSGEPQVIDNDEARRKLMGDGPRGSGPGGCADGLLLHDRPIARRLDDSVARLWGGEPQLLRRARGYAPATLELPPGMEGINRQRGEVALLACGGDLKATLTFIQPAIPTAVQQRPQALVTHHLGDLAEPLAHEAYCQAFADYSQLFGQTPRGIAIDLHPDYRASRFGRELAAARRLPLVEVQHHHAHIAATMAERGWPLAGGAVLGIALAGTGYGPDEGDGSNLWGGALLLCGYPHYRRLGGLAPRPLLGGAAAVRQPWRNLVAQLAPLGEWSHLAPQLQAAGLGARLANKPVATLLTAAKRGINCPLASSTARLFDAVAAALDIAFDGQSYEGECGMVLEALAGPFHQLPHEAGYPLTRRWRGGRWLLDPATLWPALLADLAAEVEPARIAQRFHLGLANAIAELALELAHHQGVGAIALGGAVVQNALLQQ